MKTMLVMPTCRPDSACKMLTAWKGLGGWHSLCVIEDAPEKSREMADLLTGFQPCHHFSHKEIEEYLGADSWIISKKDSAIRCFGFLIAYRAGMDVITLDDDCFPSLLESDCFPSLLERSVSIVDDHRNAMEFPRWTESVPGKRTRGLPYRNRGTMESDVNVGLWTGVPDLDGPQGLLQPETDFEPPLGSRLVPANQYVPMCGMNLYIKHRALPLAYFPLMGKDQPYKRFDDIWSGVIMKRCLDALGWSMSVGEPFVEHRRASDPLANLEKETPGIIANEWFWDTIDSVDLSMVISPIKAMQEVGNQLSRKDGYVAKLGEAIQVWTKLMEK